MPATQQISTLYYVKLLAAAVLSYLAKFPFSLIVHFNLISIFIHRQACIHAVAGNKAHAQQEACNIAKGYAVLATTGLLPALMPPICVQCSDADGPKKIADEYKLSVPAKQADVIVVVETTAVSTHYLSHYFNVPPPCLSQGIKDVVSATYSIILSKYDYYTTSVFQD